MNPEKVDYNSLESDYANSASLMYKKIRLVDTYIPNGGKFLDIGIGTGELILLRRGKHEYIYGIDYDETSLQICKEKFNQDTNITIYRGDINDIQKNIHEKLDCITCLDILEHIEENKVPDALKKIFTSLKKEGIFIFSGPGVFEKIRIALGQSTHLHSHSSYGWKRYIEDAGFTITDVQSVEFPVIHSEFLRKNLHLFGKCCVIVAQKKNGS